MKRNKSGIGILLLTILIGMVLIPAVNAQQTENFSENEYYFPDYGPSTFADLEYDSDVIETRGVIPEITDIKEKVQWLDTLGASIRSSKDELEPKMTKYGGPLAGFGINYYGYLFIEFDEELGDDIDKSTIDNLYNIIEADAKKMNISNVPVVFRMEKKVILDSRTSQWTDMYGGIGITYRNASNTSQWYSSTLSYAAVDSSGTEGFVISGHSADTAGRMGADIYQGGRKVGDVAYYNFIFADAAWVEADVDAVDDVYYTTDTDQKDVTDSDDPNLGNKVYKSGINTGLTYGDVTETYITKNHPYFGYLYEQFVADYTSGSGDSGCPVFKTTVNGVKLVGVHWGHNSTRSFFSPISGVESDLGVVALE